MNPNHDAQGRFASRGGAGARIDKRVAVGDRLARMSTGQGKFANPEKAQRVMELRRKVQVSLRKNAAQYGPGADERIGRAAMRQSKAPQRAEARLQKRAVLEAKLAKTSVPKAHKLQAKVRSSMARAAGIHSPGSVSRQAGAIEHARLKAANMNRRSPSNLELRFRMGSGMPYAR